MDEWVGLAALAAAAGISYAAICAGVAHRFTTARRRAGGASDAAVARELALQQVHFPARDQRARIAAWYLPVPHSRGAVVFVHGKDSCRGEQSKSPTLALARRFNARGLTVLMIDLRGHGSSSAARLTYGERERDDVLGAVDYLLERGCGHGTIGVLGASMGGAAALRAAAAEDAIGAIAVDSPYADFGVMIDRRFAAMSRLPRLFLPGALLFGRLLTGIDLRRVRPIEHARRLVGRPLLVIHGRQDPLVPVTDARAIAIAGQATLWLTDSRGHLGTYRDDPVGYETRLGEFFATHLPAAAVRQASPSGVAEGAATAPGFDPDFVLA